MGYFLEFIEVIIVFLVLFYIHDKYVQRSSSLLINYPIIGRMRYLFEVLREPLRQYFAEEQFYESRDKIDWVYKASREGSNFLSFSVSQPFSDSRFILKHSNIVLNHSEVSDDFSVTFGGNKKKPFVTNSIISRSAMSDGALSPEATRACAIGAFNGKFPINTGEGGLTSNYFFTHKLNSATKKCFERIPGTDFHRTMFKLTNTFFNGAIATKIYRNIVLKNRVKDTYILDRETMDFYRPDWNAPLENFPKEVPSDIPDIILQVGSGLYGVRDENGDFDPIRYQKVMSFCKMTEIKIAQGAKQTGGKILADKVTEDIAYYRGVEVGKDLISPNRFPFAKTTEDLFDFMGRLQELSNKPVGMKIVISDTKAMENMVKVIDDRLKKSKAIPDFITVDAGDGGSATAPLELMETIGLSAVNSLYILDTLLRKYKLKDRIKIIISGKILTPDDVATMLCLGADLVAIARGFMMSGGCIRARHCSGANGKHCPVGMATQDKKLRASYLVVRKSKHIEHYHNSLIAGVKNILAVMGIAHKSKFSKEKLAFKNKIGEVYFDVDKYFHNKLHI